MMTAYTWLIYAGLLGLIYVALCVRVSMNRASHKVSIGQVGSTEFQLVIRMHANFTENVPLALILLLGVESLHWPLWSVHALGILLVVARVIHILGMSKPEVNPLRRFGAVSTWAVILVESVLILFRSIQLLV